MLNMQQQQQQQSTVMGGGIGAVIGSASAMLTGPGGVSLGSNFSVHSSLTALGPVGGALTKTQREIYVGNLPPGVSIPQLTDFVNYALRQLGVNPAAPVGSVVSAWVSGDGHFAFIELRSIEEANITLAYLSGVQVGAFALKAGRPKASGPSGLTVPMATTPFTAHMLGLGPFPGGVPVLGGYPMPPITSTAEQLGNYSSGFGGNSSFGGVHMLSDSTVSVAEPLSNVVMITNIPFTLSEEQIKELMSPFGQVSKLHCDRNTVKAC